MTNGPLPGPMTPLEAQLLKFEGCKLHPYWCPTGRLTIGIGRLLEPPGGITREEAIILLRNDIRRLEAACAKRFQPWWQRLAEPRQRALLDLGFNCGFSGLLGFSKMLRAVSEGRFTEAAQEMRSSLWARQVQKARVEYLTYLLAYGQEPQHKDP